MCSNIYQIKTRAFLGELVQIDAPYDKYGEVVKTKENGFHLIKGIGNEEPKNAVIFKQ